MKKYTEPLLTERRYHIFNRGINGEDLFKEARNFPFFLKKYFHYIEPIAETYAYCLLKNHFHFLIRTRNDQEIIKRLKVESVSNAVDLAPKLISKQFALLFNSYSQSINKAYGRTGGLFERPFRRIPVNEDAHFTNLVKYIHVNPRKHGFVTDFKTYPHSSFEQLLSGQSNCLSRREVISWFGNEQVFLSMHESYQQDLDKNQLLSFDT